MSLTKPSRGKSEEINKNRRSFLGMAAMSPRPQSHHELWRVPFQKRILHHESTGEDCLWPK